MAFLGEAARDGVQLVWVLRPEDYLTCETAAGEFRSIQRRNGSRVSLKVIAVGPHPDWAEAFLQRQRVTATVRGMSDEEFRSTFDRQPLPALYVVRDGVLAAMVPTGRDDAEVGQIAGIIDPSVAGSEEVRGGANHPYNEEDS